MENPGFVTFRDWLLLLDKDSPAENVQRSFNVNAHELAHQWTGDAVTMEWWDDLWLNEAFATWMQQKITMQLHPDYNANLDRISGAQRAMENDSLVSARKIRQPITGNGDIETVFDGITYQKGAAVLAMFEAFVGEDVFREGMRACIAKHKFGNATARRSGRCDRRSGRQGRRFQGRIPQLPQSTGCAVSADRGCPRGRQDRGQTAAAALSAAGVHRLHRAAMGHAGVREVRQG
uniref:Aminopeptidase N n=1 Tax=Xanthomonas vasicola pv. vasculorum NCPPB 890 TaxID=1184265 RepID=A0A836NZS7_XANVA